MTDKVLDILQNDNIEGVLITSPANVRYISGYTGTDACLFISRDNNYLFTDARYIEHAQNEVKNFEIIKISGDFSKCAEHIKKLDHKAIGFEDTNLSVSLYEKIKEILNNACLTPISSKLKELRAVKSNDEIENMKRAAEIAESSFLELLPSIKIGATEYDLALELEFNCRKRGATSMSFPTIAASGKRSSLPHGEPTGKKLEKGDFFTLDFGCIYNGYCSDMTRTIVIGKANMKQKNIYDTVLEAQNSVLSTLHSGMSCSEADGIAREIIAKNGYGEYFKHSLGHGVGLEIHEFPALSSTSTGTLQKNMVVTVEPGVYIPEFGGVRIEDMVLIKDDGIYNFNSLPKQLIELE